MWDRVQAEVLPQLGEVVEELDEAPVVGLEERFEHQAREELWLGIHVRTEAMPVIGKDLLGGAKGLPGHAQRGLAELTHP